MYVCVETGDLLIGSLLTALLVCLVIVIVIIVSCIPLTMCGANITNCFNTDQPARGTYRHQAGVPIILFSAPGWLAAGEVSILTFFLPFHLTRLTPQSIPVERCLICNNPPGKCCATGKMCVRTFRNIEYSPMAIQMQFRYTLFTIMRSYLANECKAEN